MFKAFKWLVGAIGYWTLFAGAMILFAAAVLLPEWQAYQQLGDEHAALTERVGRLRAGVERLERARELLPTDAATNERLARMQLGYRQAGEVEVWVPPPLVRQASAVQARRPVEALPPECDEALAALMAAANRPRSRSLMLVIAGALLLAAIAVGIPTSKRKRTPRRPPQPEAASNA